MLIFDSRPDPERHPDRLRTLARLCGLTPLPLSRATVLDIGCGTGMDILAHALLYPNAQFTGIDISADFINLGQQIIEQLKLNNIQLICQNLQTYSTKQKFDYIICHGLYSWIDEDLRNSTFKLLTSQLSEHGLAYVSFNSLPGWHYRQTVQKLIALFDKPNLTVDQRVARAFESIDNALLALSDHSDHYKECLAAELEACRKQSPAFIYHELLNNNCQAEYFHEFCDRVTKFGLQYVADGRPTRTRSIRFDTVEQSRAEQLGLKDLTIQQIEQFWDCLQPPSIRGAILTKAEKTLSPQPEYSHIIDMYMTSGLTSTANLNDLTNHKTVVYTNPRNLLIEVNEPSLKLLLDFLAKQWPVATAVKELLTNSALSTQLLAEYTQPDKSILIKIGEYFLQGLIQIYSEPPLCANNIAAQPKVFPLAICQAEIGFAWVTNTRFEYLPISEFDRELIKLLNGQNDIATSCQKLLEKINTQKIEFTVASEFTNQQLPELLRTQVEASIAHYFENALFITDQTASSQYCATQ